MSTRRNPGEHDCYAAALPDEPLFVLLGRDPDAPAVVQAWAKYRLYAILRGSKPETDRPLAEEALRVAGQMKAWREANDGRWRDEKPTPTTVSTAAMRESLAAWCRRNPDDGHARLVGFVLQDLEARL